MAEIHQATTKLGDGGRIVIPAKYRQALGLRPGDPVILRLDDGELRLYSREQARRRAQEMICRLIPPSVSLVEELIRERRKEAARD